MGRQGDIGPDRSLDSQDECFALRIIGSYIESFVQVGPATIARIDHNTDRFLATGRDMPRIRGYRATSVGSNILDHQRG